MSGVRLGRSLGGGGRLRVCFLSAGIWVTCGWVGNGILKQRIVRNSMGQRADAECSAFPSMSSTCLPIVNKTFCMNFGTY